MVLRPKAPFPLTEIKRDDTLDKNKTAVWVITNCDARLLPDNKAGCRVKKVTTTALGSRFWAKIELMLVPINDFRKQVIGAIGSILAIKSDGHKLKSGVFRDLMGARIVDGVSLVDQKDGEGECTTGD